MLTIAVHDETPRRRHLRLLGADLVFRMPVLSELARKAGSTLACNPDAERLLRNGEYVGVFPEGFKGIGKPYRDRYKLQRFGRGGFVSAALRTGAPIVPVVDRRGGGDLPDHRQHQAAGPGDRASRTSRSRRCSRGSGRWECCRCRASGSSSSASRSRPPRYTEEADDPIVVFNLADQVRETIQQTLHTLLERRPDPFG